MLARHVKKDWATRGLLGATSAIALVAVIGVATPRSALAFTCDSVTNPAAGNAGANDNGDSENTACGKNAVANGGKATAYGVQAGANASESVAVGANAQADAIQGIAIGRNAHVFNSAEGGIAIGRNAQSFSSFAVAVGESSNASGDRSVAIGKGAQATGNFSTAIGNGADTNDFAASTAIGVGAQALAANQMVFGRATETYTMPGITSGLSKARQSGPLEVVTSDANGNLASDGGSIFRELDQLDGQVNRLSRDIDTVESGVAIAMSAVGPDLTGVERFGLSLNWGGFEGASAIGGGGTAVIYRGESSRLAVTGGIGVGVSGDNAVGGRAGGQLTW